MAGKRRASAGLSAIAGHRLFPLTLALWTAALFGLCSAVVGQRSLEWAVVASGLDTLVPAAAPPLGAPARLLVAAGMAALGALVGGALGLVIGRRTRRAKPEASPGQRPPAKVRARDAHPDAPPRLPLSISEECGDDGLASTEAPAGRRRGPAAIDHAEEFFEEAPLPGGPVQLAEEFDEIEVGELELAAAPSPPPEPEAGDVLEDLAEPASALPVWAKSSVDLKGERLAEASLEGMSTLQLTERLGIAMQRFGERRGYGSLLVPADGPRLADGSASSYNISPLSRASFAERADPEETARALRAALESLQRMSGAA